MHAGTLVEQAQADMGRLFCKYVGLTTCVLLVQVDAWLHGYSFEVLCVRAFVHAYFLSSLWMHAQ